MPALGAQGQAGIEADFRAGIDHGMVLEARILERVRDLRQIIVERCAGLKGERAQGLARREADAGFKRWVVRMAQGKEGHRQITECFGQMNEVEQSVFDFRPRFRLIGNRNGAAADRIHRVLPVRDCTAVNSHPFLPPVVTSV